MCVSACVWACARAFIWTFVILTLLLMVAVQQLKSPRDGQKKRKKTQNAGDEPESKVGKTESKESSDATKGTVS